VLVTSLHPAGSSSAALCVDLDGTLIKSDLLVETLLRWIKANPLRLFLALLWWARGRACLKAELASRVELDVAQLPVNDAVLDWLRQQKRAGRKIVLCTSANQRVASQVAARLNLFDLVIASDATHNLTGRAKADRLVAEFGELGFDYVGNEARDLHIWKHAHAAIVVADRVHIERWQRQLGGFESTFELERASARDWVQALRIHQWAKNLLLFVPLISAHRLLDWGALVDVVLAFVLFGCCASGTYLINDALDLDADRRHPQKRLRPLASGKISLTHGVAVAVALVCGSVVLAAITLPVAFVVALLLYVATTLWYSFLLKRIAMVDVLSLAGLYTLRVLAGSAAAAVIPSFWLLAFAMFLFLSLAMAKRYAELRSLLDAGRDRASGRGYSVTDLPLLHSFGIAAGYVCVLVFALYVNLGAPSQYSKPQIMWVVCALLLYWISRVWLKTFRGQMQLDPVVFALTDRPSLLVGVLSALLVLAAI
jgi:4-hydroxybenzoate polyprenyltransferase/phosphoserine phosphatase